MCSVDKAFFPILIYLGPKGGMHVIYGCMLYSIFFGIFPGHVEVIKGSWELDVSAGGSRNDLQKFATNPQYLLTLTQPGDTLLKSSIYSVINWLK